MSNKTVEDITAALDETRVSFRYSPGERSSLLVPNVDSPHRVGFLVTVDGFDPGCVILLKHGTNEIGRGCPEYVTWRSRLAGVIEGWQWRIECDSRTARVQDTRSTEGSVVLRAGTALASLARTRQAGTGVQLGWDGVSAHEEFVALNEGDILVNQYRAFAFGWV